MNKKIRNIIFLLSITILFLGYFYINSISKKEEIIFVNRKITKIHINAAIDSNYKIIYGENDLVLEFIDFSDFENSMDLQNINKIFILIPEYKFIKLNTVYKSDNQFIKLRLINYSAWENYNEKNIRNYNIEFKEFSIEKVKINLSYEITYKIFKPIGDPKIDTLDKHISLEYQGKDYDTTYVYNYKNISFPDSIVKKEKIILN